MEIKPLNLLSKKDDELTPKSCTKLRLIILMSPVFIGLIALVLSLILSLL